MPKTTRGKTLIDKKQGTCPKCKSTKIKLLYTGFIDGKEVSVCKKCRK